MENTPLEVLKKYWGYDSFRPLQKEIIDAAILGNNLLALLPTGGGKSICFQVPALLKPGLCLVISPLIALMKDQVDQLKRRGINAEAIYSELSSNEIDILFSRCKSGDIKFLYISPERIKSRVFVQRIINIPVSLVAVDEAHCISQWGYDFRPSYLEIAKIKQLTLNPQIIALTATATKKVQLDILEKLEIETARIFKDSFKRENLIYYAIKEENKLYRLLRICSRLNGSGLVYVRSRKKTEKISTFLNQNGISSRSYNAGLAPEIREQTQESWIKGEIRIIVCTNAFGMGIDKPDCRFVVHLEIPESPEAYFQEAGRAGRDGELAKAILLFQNSDEEDAFDNHERSFPPLDEIKRVYQCIANFLQLPIGSGEDQYYEFPFDKFCTIYSLNPILAYNAIKWLEKESYIVFNNQYSLPSRIRIIVKPEELYDFELKNKKFEFLIKSILRTYNNTFQEFVKINEFELAKRTQSPTEKIIELLTKLNNLKIIEYLPKIRTEQLLFCTPRQEAKSLYFNPQRYFFRKEEALKRLNAIVSYSKNESKCRSILLLEYFEEQNSSVCGKCDVCLKNKRKEISENEFEKYSNFIRIELLKGEVSLKELINIVPINNEKKIIEIVRWWMEEGLILEGKNGKLFWKKD